jgi:hypothetical protein
MEEIPPNCVLGAQRQGGTVDNFKKVRAHIVIGFITLIVVSLACGSATTINAPTPVSRQSTVQNTPTASPSKNDFLIVPFGYDVRDGGEGWKEGSIVLGFVNTSDRLLNPQKVVFQFVEATVETLEGKTYPANLYLAGLAYTDVLTNVFQVALDKLPPIPSKLPISAIAAVLPTHGATIEYQNFRNIIRFRFAQAAHPTQLILRSPTSKVTIDLSSETESTTPTPLPGFSAHSLNNFANAISQLNPRLQVEIGECRLRLNDYGNADYYTLPYTATNTNQLDEEQLDFAYATWHSTGIYDIYDPALVRNMQGYRQFVKAGPGQTVKGELKWYGPTFYVYQGLPIYLVVYGSDQMQVQIYDLGCPKPTQ